MNWNPAVNSDRKQLCESINIEFDEASVAILKDERREHLGVSQIGDKCSRKLWYQFRWVKEETVGSLHYTEGQMRRLWKRGHREEEVFIQILEQAGHKFIKPKNGKQHRIPPFALGHGGGSCDNIGYLPEHYGLSEPILYEFKTIKEVKFNNLKKVGVARCDATEKHYEQMNFYGAEFNLNYALYCSVNKNTDEIYFEFVVLSPTIRDELKTKGLEIVTTTTAPEKFSPIRTNYYCKMCSFAGICHDGEAIEKNCRSCKNAKPVEGGKWFCQKWESEIPKDGISVGCDAWEPIVYGIH